MFSLYKDAEYYVEYKHKRYSVNLAFNTVLAVFSVYKDDLLTDQDKISIIYDMFIDAPCLSIIDRSKIVTLVLEKFISTDDNGEPEQERIVDFEQDANYIYAGFMQAYNIDLLKQKNIMPWDSFLALFQGLPDSTKIKEIMQIRARPLPTPTKYNAQEIQNLLKLKQAYAIKKPQGKTNVSKQFAGLFQTLKERAGDKING